MPTNIIQDGQLAASSATLQTGGGPVSIHMHNTHSASLTAILTVAHGTDTARTIFSRTLDAGGAALITGLALGPGDVLAGYSGTASKIDYLIQTCPETVPLSVQVFDANGSIKSGGSAFSPVDLAATGRITTTDSVASGTTRIVGGQAKEGVSASDTLLASAGASAAADFATTYSIPANTLKSGTRLRVRVLVRVSDASGSDTLAVGIVLGSTVLILSTAVNPGATTDLHIVEFEITSRAAASAASSLVGSGRWITNTGGTIAHGTGLLGATNFATNGALALKAQATWSSTTASTAATLEQFSVDVVG